MVGTSVALSRVPEDKRRLVFVVSKGGLTNEKPKIGSVVFLSHRQKAVIQKTHECSQNKAPLWVMSDLSHLFYVGNV